MVEDVGDLVGPEHEVHRHEDSADPGRREGEDGVLPAVVRQQGHPIALGHPLVCQRCRYAVDCRVELGEGQPRGAVDDRNA
jgi:hypothetical protein